MARILVIDDGDDDQPVIALHQEGHTVWRASLAEALPAAKQRAYDAVLVPDAELCRALRAEPSTQNAAILVLSADCVSGLEAGADDCMVKPVSFRELALRVRALLRRRAITRFELGCLRVDCECRRAWVHGERVDLTSLELKLLVTLHRHRGRVTTRDVLLREVWGTSAGTTPRTIDSHVRHLREKLKGAATYIATVRGVGYRLSS